MGPARTGRIPAPSKRPSRNNYRQRFLPGRSCRWHRRPFRDGEQAAADARTAGGLPAAKLFAGERNGGLISFRHRETIAARRRPPFGCKRLATRREGSGADIEQPQSKPSRLS